MNTVKSFRDAARFVFTEPKFVAQLEWHRKYGLGGQLEEQWPRDEMEAFAATGQHPHPERRVRLVLNEMPDFDWWEPRYDQSWRRQDARRREWEAA
jgi:hypothetical protein